MPNWLQFPQSEIMPSSFTGKMDTARASTRTNICDPYALVPSARVSNLARLSFAFPRLIDQEKCAKQLALTFRFALTGGRQQRLTC